MTIIFYSYTRRKNNKNGVNLSNYLLFIKPLHVHIQYVCSILAKFTGDKLKVIAIAGVGFTKYAL